MMLVASLLLALIPLLGIGWIVLSGAITTVDGLFMSLILAAISGILVLNAGLEMGKRRTVGGRSRKDAEPGRTSSGVVQRGRVENVQFYEAHVGERNKSIVMLSNDGSAAQMLVFEGDMRNALPIGQMVHITFRKESGYNVLANVEYP